MKISYPKRIVEIKSLYDQLPIAPTGLNPLVNTCEHRKILKVCLAIFNVIHEKVKKSFAETQRNQSNINSSRQK